MTQPYNVVDAIISSMKEYLANNLPPIFTYATWMDEEAVDSNLSEIQFPDGTLANGVPKLAHVTSLVAGDQVLCINANGAGPLTIVGKVVGDISAI